MQKPSFRTVAVSRLSSPDQLDAMMQVTTPLGWVALVALLVLLGVGLVWGIVGSIPTQVKGEGMLLRAGGVNAVVAPAAGQLATLSVAAGDQIAPGQIVAEIEDAAQATRVSVTSPFAGRVIEIAVTPGAFVDRGTRLFSLVDESQPLEAVVYLTPADGKKVHPGMLAQISPATVAREEYGYLMGSVSAVGEFPTTYEGMLRVLQNADLVTALRAGGAPIEVRVALVADATTPSGYQWSSPQGPPAAVQIENGTPATAFVTISTQRPLSLVLPIVK